MKAIYSCKLYKAHKNKEKIQAAIGDPANKGLVQQLRQYLDDEYIKPEYVDPDLLDEPKDDEAKVDVKDSAEDNASPTSAPSSQRPASFTPSGGPSGGPSKLERLADDLENEETSDEVPPADDEANEPPVAESTKVRKPAITSSFNVQLSTSFITDTCTEVKGLLNIRQDTCGVDRVQFKDDEVWIYYNDKINLNNVMSAVIDVLNASGYTYLDFNRLARTDNSIVFQMQADMMAPKKPISQDGE